MTLAAPADLAQVSFPAIGTTASMVLTEPGQCDRAAAILRSELDAIDRAASRFRADSELVGVNAAAGRALSVSPLLFRAIGEAIRAARLTDGLVDPTVGQALILAGYDRDFGDVEPDGPPLILRAQPVPGWRAVRTDPVDRTVRVPAGVTLDLGATAKALCADLAADRIAAETGAGVLVNLGGDIAARGPAPEGGWSVRITHDHALSPETAEGPVISIQAGGLATSTTSVRRWLRGGTVMHHLIDPATGLPATEHWRTVSVAAADCVDANIGSCAAILLGPAAPAWLEEQDLPARLIDPTGAARTVAGWPEDTGWPREPGRHAVAEPVGC
jgi:thiamine biosynthesis lipoprotein